MIWRNWEKETPLSGSKVVIVCADGLSSSLALVTDAEVLDGEDGYPISKDFLRGAIWQHLPDDYELAFTDWDDVP